MEYSRVFGSNYPNEQIKISEKKDINNEVMPYITEIQKCINNNDLAGATKIIQTAPIDLEPYNINAMFINLLQEHIYNIGIYATSKQNTIIGSSAPTNQLIVGSYWIKDVK